jgi:hypothetical protein
MRGTTVLRMLLSCLLTLGIGILFLSFSFYTEEDSTGYEITLNLDANMTFLNMTERHLSWVHANIFHGKQMTPSKNILIPENDIRSHVQTAEPIATNSNLFKFVFPSGSTDSCPLLQYIILMGIKMSSLSFIPNLVSLMPIPLLAALFMALAYSLVIQMKEENEVDSSGKSKTCHLSISTILAIVFLFVFLATITSPNPVMMSTMQGDWNTTYGHQHHTYDSTTTTLHFDIVLHF